MFFFLSFLPTDTNVAGTQEGGLVEALAAAALLLQLVEQPDGPGAPEPTAEPPPAPAPLLPGVAAVVGELGAAREAAEAGAGGREVGSGALQEAVSGALAVMPSSLAALAGQLLEVLPALAEAEAGAGPPGAGPEAQPGGAVDPGRLARYGEQLRAALALLGGALRAAQAEVPQQGDGPMGPTPPGLALALLLPAPEEAGRQLALQ